jgi:hypothetical protein
MSSEAPDVATLTEPVPTFVAAGACVTATDCCMPAISPRLAQAMAPPPSAANSEPYAEQPRHHTVTRAVQRAVSRAMMERERVISREDTKTGRHERNHASTNGSAWAKGEWGGCRRGLAHRRHRSKSIRRSARSRSSTARRQCSTDIPGNRSKLRLPTREDVSWKGSCHWEEYVDSRKPAAD